MRTAILDQDIPLGDKKRLIKRLWKVDKGENFPNGLEFAYQFLYFKNNEWVQIARIDNQLHENKAGVHIHTLNHEKVEWREMSFESAEAEILEMGERIIKNILAKKIVAMEKGDQHEN